jgi:hypothetical protein
VSPLRACSPKRNPRVYPRKGGIWGATGPVFLRSGASATFSKETLQKLLESHTVIIAMENDAQSEVSVQFDLPDSTQVAQTCGIDLRKK